MKNLTEKTYICKNGLPIYYTDNPDIGAFSISVYLRHGAMHDPENETGFAHFYEHAVFANISFIMDGKLDETTELHGLTFNGSTYYDYTEFVISGASENFRLAAEIISKVFAPFTLTRKKLMTEVRRIKAEIAEGDRSSLTDISYKAIYGGTSLCRPITGKCSAVNKYGVKMLKKKQKEMLSIGNVFVYAGGNIPDGEIDLLASLCEKYTFYSGHPVINGNIPLPEDFGNRDCAVTLREDSSTSVLISFDISGRGYSLPELFCFADCFDWSSPIYTELSVNRGLIYSFDCDLTIYGNIRSLSISYSIRSDKLYESLGLLFNIFKNAKTALGKRLPFVLPIYTDNIYNYTDYGDEASSTFGYSNHILGCGYRSISERLEAYRAVIPEKMEEIAKAVLTPENLSVIIKGNRKRIDENKIKELAFRSL